MDESKTYFAINEVEAPCLIVGSSRASHHYVPSMIEDSINIDTYNVGRDGCFFSYNCAMNNAIINRYTPEIILWEFSDTDLFNDNDNRLESLYPYYGKNTHITKIIDETENSKRKIQLSSGLYKYNSIALRIISRSITSGAQSCDKNKGYLPLKPEESKSNLILKYDSIPQNTLNEVRVKQFEETIQAITSRGTKLFLFFSPKYKLVDTTKENESYIETLKICSKYNVPVFDNTNIPEFIANPSYFKDLTHLNSKGAERYTEIIIEQIRPYL